MGRRGLLFGAALLLIPLTTAAAVRWITSPVHPERPGRAIPRAASPSSPPAATGDPNLPRLVGETRRLAARAIDDTAGAPLDRALVALAHRSLGTPARPALGATAGDERLELDLTAVDSLSFVEQLVALVNSREVRTRTEGVDRFSDHVRQLRYIGGRVEACRRLRHPSLWALAAERRGYLVDLSRFLPGAQQRRLPLGELLPAARLTDSGGSSRAGRCRLPEGTPASVTLAEVPLPALPGALPSLRSGDVFVLVSRSTAPAAGGIGLVDLQGERPAALLVRPGQGVVRSDDLLGLAHSVPSTAAVSFLRPIPNPDGKPDR